MDKSRKDYVRNHEHVDQSQICFFCMDVCMDPIQCLGPCKSVCCRRCASEWCQNGRRVVGCPKKCSEPWQFQLIPHKKLEMECPYSTTCKIEYVEDLEKHLQSCPFSPEEVQKVNSLRNHYMCVNNHELKFFVGSFAEIVNSTCQECTEKGDCRSKCPKCGVMYCVKCRAPPCSKECCPLGHNYKFVKPARKSTICDMCGMSAGLVDLGVHSDPACNFDVCELCFDRLPASNSSNEIVKRIRDIVGNKCKQNHQLTVKTEPLLGVCSGCALQKVCWKECIACKEFYCLACKEPKCTRNLQCEFRHKYTIFPSNQPCMLCGEAKQDLFCRDEQCKISMCQHCISRLISIDSEKRRMKVYLSCEKGHVLHYDYRRFLKTCTLCKTQKEMCLFCSECRPLQFYCMSCRPLPWKQTCYFDDPIEQQTILEDEGPHTCLVCQKKSNTGMLWCRHCKFEICEECRLS